MVAAISLAGLALSALAAYGALRLLLAGLSWQLRRD